MSAGEYTLGDGPIEATLHAQMNAIAEVLDEFLNGDAKHPNKEIGFVLLTFKYGERDGRRCNYISNGADRKDMISLLKELAARFEGQPEIEGHG